jgi:hypothetical protein
VHADEYYRVTRQYLHGMVTAGTHTLTFPETESGAPRQAFLDHGRSIGIKLSDVPQDTPSDPHDAIKTASTPRSVQYFV